MRHSARLWQDIIEPFRASDWQDCIRLARSAVDRNSDDLAVRFLLAGLYLVADDPHIAQLQYERLLPLAVGQGDLFRALAAQKHLDALHPSSARHARRYAAMHQWFHSLGRGGRGKPRPNGNRGITSADLIGLSTERFSEIAEGARIETLGLEPRTLEAGQGALWVVLYGRARGYLEREGLGELTEGFLQHGDCLSCVPGCEEVARVRIIPELPTECLALDPELLAELGAASVQLPGSARGGATEPEAPAADATEAPLEIAPSVEAPPGAAGPAPAPTPAKPATPALVARDLVTSDFSTPGRAAPDPTTRDLSKLDPAAPAPPNRDLAKPAPATPEPAPREREPRAAPPPPTSRPTPDPTAEPLVAMFAPLERRPETRIAISLEDRTALLGFAGTRVAPIRGVLHSLSAAGITVGFRREELLPMRSALDGAAVRVNLNLDGRAVLQFAVRMTWVEVDAAARQGAASADAIFSLDFLAVSPGDLTRIGEAGAQPGQGPTALAA